MGILQVFTLLGALGMFLYGMNLMSSGLQKAAGERLRGFLSAMTSNPLKGVLTGMGITAIIQSSSATTVIPRLEPRYVRWYDHVFRNDGGCYGCSRRSSSRPYGNEAFHGLFR